MPDYLLTAIGAVLVLSAVFVPFFLWARTWRKPEPSEEPKRPGPGGWFDASLPAWLNYLLLVVVAITGVGLIVYRWFL
jgi:hypothetical protein